MPTTQWGRSAVSAINRLDERELAALIEQFKTNWSRNKDADGCTWTPLTWSLQERVVPLLRHLVKKHSYERERARRGYKAVLLMLQRELRGYPALAIKRSNYQS